MDNLTHSLVGLAFGESTRKHFKKESRGIEEEILLASVIANNLPDGDLLITLFSGDGQIGNLLHHRGITHTLIFAPVMAVLTVMLVRLLTYVKKKPGVSKKQALFLLAVSVFGVFTHVGADFCNDYGVHPFWPIRNHWYYGDSVFILEPLIWLALSWCFSPYFIKISSRKVSWQNLLCGFSLALLFFFPGVETMVGVFAFLWYLACRSFFKAVSHPALRLAPLGVLLSVFFLGSWATKEKVRGEIQRQKPAEEVIDILASPSPSNPFCWRMIASSTEKDRYLVRMGYVSHWPLLFDPTHCHFRKMKGGDAPMVGADLSSTKNIQWIKMSASSLKNMDGVVRENCTFASFLKFSRFPFLMELGQDEIYIGDHRYDFDKTIGFSEFLLSRKEAKCPKLNASWQPPFLRRFQSFVDSNADLGQK